jgi:phospholipid transport system substrate-binding protein
MPIVPRVALLLALVVSGVDASVVWGGQPTDELRSYVDRVITVLETPGMKTPTRAAERHRVIRAIADEGIDFREAARRALGPYWNPRTAEEQARFIALFTELIDGGYLSRVAGYDGEKLAYDAESIDGNEAIVQTRVIAKDGDITPVAFHLVRGADGRWRVWDAVFEGMSLVGNYRAQFSRILRSASYEELLKRLEGHTRTGQAR